MERRQLESIAVRYPYLRGLGQLPLAALLVLCAGGNSDWGPLGRTWVFLLALVGIGAAWLAISRYYDEHFGRVTPSARRQARDAALAVVGAGLMFGAALLLRSRAGWSLDLPVNPIAACFGAWMLAWSWASVGRHRHQLLIWGALALTGLLPVWNGGDPGDGGLLLAAVAVALNGICDHRLLARGLMAPLGPGPQPRNAGA